MYSATIPFRSPVILKTEEAEFIPALRDLARQYVALRDTFQLSAACMPAAQIEVRGERFGHITYKGGVWRRQSPLDYPALITGAC